MDYGVVNDFRYQCSNPHRPQHTQSLEVAIHTLIKRLAFERRAFKNLLWQRTEGWHWAVLAKQKNPIKQNVAER
jgi:hypothetical protein